MISLNFVGDIALFSLFEEKGVDPFKEVFLPSSDFNIGNFEFIVPNNREKYFFDVSDNYKISYNYFKELQAERFNAYSLANNHCMDYGVDGSKDVMNVLSEKNIKSFGFGTNDYNILSVTVKNVSFAVIAFVKNGRWSRSHEQPQGPDPYNVEKIIDKIKSLKQSYNHVIVYPHWGTELVDIPDPKDVANARAFIDAGATAVIGHHPHIIQGVETYKNRIIAYSLGSFIYVPHKEVGYSKSQGYKRDYSICLNLKIDETQIKEYTPVFYKYNNDTLLPQQIEDANIIDYYKELNLGINDKTLYSKKVRKQLFAREVKSFFQRFKNAPVKTVVHYFKYIKIDHFKKLFK